MGMVPEFHIINKGIAREIAGKDDTTDVLKAVFQDLAKVDGLGLDSQCVLPLCLKLDHIASYPAECTQ